MIFYILRIIGGLFDVAGKLFDYLNRKQMVDLGKTAEKLESLKARVDAAGKAVRAREAVREHMARNPDSIVSDDGFKRPD